MTAKNNIKTYNYRKFRVGDFVIGTWQWWVGKRKEDYYRVAFVIDNFISLNNQVGIKFSFNKREIYESQNMLVLIGRKLK